MSSPSAAWHPDPSGRHQWRWWDGSAWTVHVADDGDVSADGEGEADGRAGTEVEAGAEVEPEIESAIEMAADAAAAVGVSFAVGAGPFAPGLPRFLVRRDAGPRGDATAGAVVALAEAVGPPADGPGPEVSGVPAGEVLAAVEVPAAAAPLGRGVTDVGAGARVVVRDAGGAARLTVTRPDARPTVLITDGNAPDLIATRQVDGHRWSIVFRCDGRVWGRMDPEDLLGRRWVLADTEPRVIVQRRIERAADRRRWAAVAYEVRVAGRHPDDPERPSRPPGLDAATLWVVGAVLALDLLDTQLPDRDD